MKLRDELEAVSVRQPQIEQHQGGTLLRRQTQCFATGRGLFDFVPCGTEVLAQPASKQCLIIDDGDNESRVHRTRTSSGCAGMTSVKVEPVLSSLLAVI